MTSPGDLAKALPFEATLENCDREPIHIPGSIQPHGALVAFVPAAGRVVHASTNLGQWFPVGTLPVRGRSLADLIGTAAYTDIERALAGKGGGVIRHRIVDLPARPAQGQPRGFDAVLHVQRGVCIAEFEPVVAEEQPRDWMQSLADTVDAMRSASDLADLALRTATRVKRMTQFDRVMVYEFDADWNGHVIADAHEPDMESFFDLHYPATDIPAQARELYRSNLVRYIADIGYTPVPVLPLLDTERQQPLDMSHAMLRSVSPIHIQYLKNMGVGSSLTISLMVDDRLWGLIACHHRTPTALPIRLRRACHALAVTAGYMVGWNEQRRQAVAQAAVALAQTQIVEAFNHVESSLPDLVEESGAALLRLTGSIGGAFWSDYEMLPFGRWPGGAQGASILQMVRDGLEPSPAEVMHSDRVVLPPADPTSDAARTFGVMAVRLDAFATTGIVWIRPELRSEFAWGGDPDKPVQVEIDADGRPRLSPRSSFARWVTVVKGRSRAWTEQDIQAARSLLTLRHVLTVRDALAAVSLSDRHFRSLVDLQSDAYCQLDMQGRVVTLSKPLPTGHGAVQGESLVALFEPFCAAEEIGALRTALSGNQAFRDLRLHGRRARDRPEFVVQLGGEPMVDPHGRIAGWHGTITDMTLEVAVQAALRQKEAAEISNLAKSRFLSQMGHELRTPLNAVLGFSQLLLMDAGVSRPQREQIGHIQRAGDWLLEMISDLMDLSLIEAGDMKLHLKAVDARSVVAATIEWVGPLAAANHVRMIRDDDSSPTWVHADGPRLRQVLGNLASNALKYNRTHGEVRFSVQPDAQPGWTRIEVQDTGVGLSHEQIARLFQPFNRLGRENQGIGGAGIGLVIADQLVLAMGGRIAVTSEPGLGSTFSVMLANQAPAEALADDPASISIDETTPERIVLLVADDPASVTLVESIVASLPNVRLVVADPPERALALARDLLPAVVLIEMALLGSEAGLELLLAIKADPALQRSRCIAVNASATGTNLAELKEAGFDASWTRPIDLKGVWSGMNLALAA